MTAAESVVRIVVKGLTLKGYLDKKHSYRFQAGEGMKEIKIKFDFDHGPIWKDRFDVATGTWSTGITVVDNDKALAVLNDAAQAEYASLYSFNANGKFCFHQEMFEEKRQSLLSLVQTIVLRANAINDGSYTVIDEETPRLRQ